MSDEINGTIHIEVSETNIKYDSAMSLPEVVFWLETVKSMIVKKILDPTSDKEGV